MRRSTIISALLVLVLTIISTVFALLTTTNKEWSSQVYYFDLDQSALGKGDNTTLCTLTRSPFYRCGIPEVWVSGTCSIPYCNWYLPSGFNKTSCRSAAEYGADWTERSPSKGLLGHRTECQEVHYAGNLQIAAVFFITFGLLVALMLVTLSITAQEERQDAASSRPHNHTSVGNKRRSMKPWVAAALLTCLYVGALLQVLAQYFGVLGLTVNAYPKSYEAIDAQKNTTRAHYVAEDWEIGKGLSTYATISWAFAIAAAAVTTAVYRTPRFLKI